MHDVLDPDDGDALASNIADGRDELADLVLGQPACDLVEQQDARAGRQRPGEFQPLALQQGQRAGQRVRLGREAGPFQHLDAVIVGRGFRLAGAERPADQQVLEHGHPAEGVRDLVRATDPGSASEVGRQAGDVLAREHDPAGVRRQTPGNQVEERALPRPVGADDAERLALLQRHVERIDHEERAEALGQVLDREDRAHGTARPSTRPSGPARDEGTLAVEITLPSP